jgi:hypothetical protein
MLKKPPHAYWTTAAGPATTIPSTVLFCTLSRILTTYVFIGAKPDLPTDDPELLGLLADLDLPELPDSIQTLLGSLLEGFLKMANARSARHKPILGGWQRPNPCTRADLDQFFYDERELALARSIQLYAPLAEDFRQIYRLARSAQRDYQGQRRAAWREKHKALAQALLRVWEVGVRLCEIGGRWFAEVCFRHLFRELWAEQFVTKVEYPEDLAPFLAPVKLTLVLRNAIIRLLRPEREAGFDVPPPFADMFRAWEAGEWPQSLNSLVTQEEWEAKVPIRLV